MDEARLQDHWALSEIFREPYGGKQSALIVVMVALYVGYGLFAWNSTMLVIAPGLVALAAAEYLPTESVRLGGIVRMVGFLWFFGTPFILWLV